MRSGRGGVVGRHSVGGGGQPSGGAPETEEQLPVACVFCRTTRTRPALMTLSATQPTHDGLRWFACEDPIACRERTKTQVRAQLSAMETAGGVRARFGPRASKGMEIRCVICASPFPDDLVVCDGKPNLVTATVSRRDRDNDPPLTVGEAIAVALEFGLALGGYGAAFAGAYGTNGLYAYKTGNHAGTAFFGTGGTVSAMGAGVSLPQYRLSSPA